MEHPLERELRSLSDADKDEILYSVLAMAEDIFSECTKDPNEFCVQHVEDDAIIFGGLNRLILGRRGWSISESHCTDRFIERFRNLGDNP